MKNRRAAKNERRLLPPPGRSATLALNQAQGRDRGTVGVVLVYVALAVAFGIPLAAVSWVSCLGAVALFAAAAVVTISVSGAPSVVVGADWLKLGGGRWVETTRLVVVSARDTTGGTRLLLRDADGRHVEVRLDELRRTPAVWQAFIAALQIARSTAEVKIDPRTARYLPT